MASEGLLARKLRAASTRAVHFQMEGSRPRPAEELRLAERRGRARPWFLLAAPLAALAAAGGISRVEPLAAAVLALDFGPQLVGTSSGGVALSVRNEGTESLAIGLAAVMGPEGGDFSIATNGCAGVRLAARRTCEVTVGFQPAAEGLRSARLHLLDGNGRAVRTAALAGVGVVQPDRAVATAAEPAPVRAAPPAPVAPPVEQRADPTLTALPGALSFTARTTRESAASGSSRTSVDGAVVHSRSESQAEAEERRTTQLDDVLVTNAGEQPVEIRSLKIAGPGAGDFQIAATSCPDRLPARTRCVVRIRFAPRHAGKSAATLTVEHGSGGPPIAVALTGTHISAGN